MLEERQMEAGIVVYRRQGNELHGRWSHSNESGKLAVERIVGVEPGALTGNWPVEIREPDGRRLFSGYVESVPFGQCFKLTWRGSLFKTGAEVTFEGIGIALDQDTLCSSFELVRPKATPTA
jgi:hypothetical protein